MSRLNAQLKQLKWMQAEAARCWEESKKPRTKVVRIEKPNGTVITETWIEDQLGDLKYLEDFRKCMVEIRAILWPNGPQEQDVAKDFFLDELGKDGLAADSELPPRVVHGERATES